MSGGGSDGQQQMHMGAPSQMQHQQMQPPMHAQMRPQSVIRQAVPVHVQQGQNIVRMQRPQVVKPGQIGVDQSTASFVPGQARVRSKIILINNVKVILIDFIIHMCGNRFNSLQLI